MLFAVSEEEVSSYYSLSVLFLYLHDFHFYALPFRSSTLPLSLLD